MSFWSQIKESANEALDRSKNGMQSAWDKTNVMAQKQKAKVEIKHMEHQISNHKKTMGLEIYDVIFYMIQEGDL